MMFALINIYLEPVCLEFTCSPRATVGFLWVSRFPPTAQNNDRTRRQWLSVPDDDLQEICGHNKCILF